MKNPLGIGPAPKRGQYDRTAGREARQSAQRERVLATVVALVGSDQPLNIASILKLAGIGRNTFYEYFDDVEHALAVLSTRAQRDLSNRLEVARRDARTPLDRLRALAQAWAAHLSEAPALARVALRPQRAEVSSPQISALGAEVVKVLHHDAEICAAASGVAETFSALAVAALFDAVSRSHFASTPLSAVELERVLFELSRRLLR